ncbi:hypothetical protein G6F47_009514 [Rhizopus delemar]|nr:hypothetical protein G6F47_009514 [Rhizopus delemar]
MSTDSPYKDEIVSCLLNLNETQQPITWENFIKSMQNIMVNSYEDKDMTDFKGDWKSRFLSSIVEERIRTSKKTSSDSSTGALEENQSVLTKNSVSTSKSSSRQPSTDKNYVLTAEEKEKCRMMYELLDVSKMWTLSTEKLVEKQMALFASNCIYEHPVHSFILDVSDSIWTDYFTTEEIREIMNTDRTALPSLPEDLSNYINSFDKEFAEPLDLYYQAHSNVFHPFQEKDKKWVQQICSSAADLYLYKMLDNCNSLEAKVKHRVWSFLYTLFDGSKLKVEIGEKSSVASAIRRNNERRLEGQEVRQRKNMGNKMDMLFFCDDCELGCTEVGKDSVGVDDDKCMGDGMLKLPKTMKDMLCMAAKAYVKNLKKNNFTVIGYARKSPGQEHQEVRVGLIQKVVNKLYDTLLVDKVLVTTSSRANDTIRSRDTNGKNAQLTLLNQVHGNTQDLLEYIFTSKDNCLVGLNLEVVMLDSPVGYASRIVRTDVFKYPKNINSFSADIIPIIEIIWKTKAVMETTMKAVENRPRKAADFCFSLQTPVIPPCFNRSDVKISQKRKLED